MCLLSTCRFNYALELILVYIIDVELSYSLPHLDSMLPQCVGLAKQFQVAK